MPRRPAGPGPNEIDDIDADLRASPEDIAAALAEPDAGQAPGDELDLHHFQPREVAGLVAEYLDAAHAAGRRAVRIIHGKGTGTLRRVVHGVLDRHPAVARYRLADDRGGWGATVVDLRS